MNIKPLLDFIASLESNSNYNAVFGNANSTQELSDYTLTEVHDAQLAHGKLTGSSAFGRYQIIRKTLLGLRTRLGLLRSEKFTHELQDRLAQSLLIARGLRRWQRGEISDDAFMDALSKEWASLPYRNGRSYYDGDGLNHALATRSEFRHVLETLRENANA